MQLQNKIGYLGTVQMSGAFFEFLTLGWEHGHLTHNVGRKGRGCPTIEIGHLIVLLLTARQLLFVELRPWASHTGNIWFNIKADLQQLLFLLLSCLCDDKENAYNNDDDADDDE